MSTYPPSDVADKQTSESQVLRAIVLFDCRLEAYYSAIDDNRFLLNKP